MTLDVIVFIKWWMTVSKHEMTLTFSTSKHEYNLYFYLDFILDGRLFFINIFGTCCRNRIWFL